MIYQAAALLLTGFFAVSAPGAARAGDPPKASKSRSAAPAKTPAGGGNPKVLIEVESFGSIQLELFADKAPKHVENILKLARQKFYDGLGFHRIIPGFVIQGGDPAGNGSGGPGYTVPAEIGLLHKRGSLAAARLPDQVNPERASSGSQFYICLNDLPQLDNQYSVFGRVIQGMEVVDKIAKVSRGPGDRPLQKVTIKRMKIISK